ncbi:MAG TPA: Hsp20/alpha crystallin family protein [Gaiellaceae bacterium]|nr:Hsp20/alpha crystallin family protein [Gaiellaceae bacterium]
MAVLDKWTPLHELELVERRMRNLFNAAGFPAPLPAADVYETDDEFVVELEAPGFEREELAVEVTDHTLTIKGTRKETTEEQEKSFRFHERLERAFERRFPLPVAADEEHLEARFERGVLEVRAPKAVAAKPRKVPIGSK